MVNSLADSFIDWLPNEVEWVAGGPHFRPLRMSTIARKKH